MKRSWKQKLFLGLAVAAVLTGGAIAAMAATNQTKARHPGGPLAAAASYLGVSTSQLRDELRSGKSLAQVADSTSGKSSKGLVDAVVASERSRLTSALANLPRRVERQVQRVGGARAPGARKRPIPVAAAYLGMKPAELRAQLRSGNSLAQVADSTSGKSAAGLIDAIVAARKTALAALVADGTLTPAQESVRLKHLTRRVTATVNRVRGQRARSARVHSPTG